MMLDPQLTAAILSRQPAQQASLSPNLTDSGNNKSMWWDMIRDQQKDWKKPFDAIDYQLYPRYVPEPNSGNIANIFQGR